jgi:hypothetical protein
LPVFTFESSAINLIYLKQLVSLSIVLVLASLFNAKQSGFFLLVVQSHKEGKSTVSATLRIHFFGGKLRECKCRFELVFLFLGFERMLLRIDFRFLPPE